MKRLKFGGALLMAAVFTAMAGSTFAQITQTPRPPLLFQEVWKRPVYEGKPTDENQRITPAVLTNSKLEMKAYGRDAQSIIVAEHEARFDLWTGLTKSPVAVTLRDKSNYIDLTGLARLRWMIRTSSIYTLNPVVRLADGSYLAGTHGISTDGEFLQVEVAFSGMRWYKLDPANVVVTSEVKNPDLSKVDEIGVVALAPGGGHGVAASANLSAVELFAKAVPR